jgi:hypothetical protein
MHDDDRGEITHCPQCGENVTHFGDPLCEGCMPSAEGSE